MVNNQDLYALSVYKNLYFGSDNFPDVNGQDHDDHLSLGGGDQALAVMAGCRWLELNESG